jgi:hypothetical protein
MVVCSPLGMVANRGGDYVSGFHPLPLGYPWQWVRVALPRIVALLCSFPHAGTRGDKESLAIEPYKPRLTYHMHGIDRGDRGRGQGAGPHGGERGGAYSASLAYRQQRLTSQHTDPHPTRVDPTFLLAQGSNP